MVLETDVKSNSIDVAFVVLDTPSMFSKSVSVPQAVSPSLRTSVFTVLPAELAFPVVNTNPFSNGKFELARSKYPKLPKPITLPFIDELMLVIITHS